MWPGLREGPSAARKLSFIFSSFSLRATQALPNEATKIPSVDPGHTYIYIYIYISLFTGMPFYRLSLFFFSLSLSFSFFKPDLDVWAQKK